MAFIFALQIDIYSGEEIEVATFSRSSIMLTTTM